MQLFSRANVLAALIILGAIGYTASQILNPSAKQAAPAAAAPPGAGGPGAWRRRRRRSRS